MFVGVVAHFTINTECGVDSGVPQLPQTLSELFYSELWLFFFGSKFLFDSLLVTFYSLFNAQTKPQILVIQIIYI